MNIVLIPGFMADRALWDDVRPALEAVKNGSSCRLLPARHRYVTMHLSGAGTYVRLCEGFGMLAMTNVATVGPAFESLQGRNPRGRSAVKVAAPCGDLRMQDG